MSLIIQYCDSCFACEKSFLTGKKCPGECVHCKSPRQKKYYIYSLGQLERSSNAISDKNKTSIEFALFTVLRTRIEK